MAGQRKGLLMNSIKNRSGQEIETTIRAAVLADASAITEIYNPYIETTTITYEYETISPCEMKQRMETVMECYPWLVLEADEQLKAYAYASEFQKRAAFQWSCEVSVYVAQGETGNGYGTALYRKLLTLLQKQGYRNIYALIDAPNLASETLHKRFGFADTGFFEHTGYKLGAWRSLLALCLKFPETETPPLPVRTNWRELL